MTSNLFLPLIFDRIDQTVKIAHFHQHILCKGAFLSKKKIGPQCLIGGCAKNFGPHFAQMDDSYVLLSV